MPMKKLHLILSALFAILVFNSCDFAGNLLKYRSRSKVFMQYLLDRKYGECINEMALEHSAFKEVNTDTLKLQLDELRTVLVRGFTNRLSYSMVKAEKKYSSRQGESTPPNATVVLLQFDNQREFGMMQFVFDDISGKILGVHILNIKRPIPILTNYWLFALLPLAVLVFNIWVIVMVRRSDIIKKWQKYLLIVFGNAPVIAYNAVTGLAFKPVMLLLMGISGSAMGYTDFSWQVGVPVGGLYVLWKLRNGLYTTKQDIEDRKRLEEQINNPTPMPETEPPATQL